MRIDKLLSNLKYGSRKEIKELCKKGYVIVNGKTISDSSTIIHELTDEIIFDGNKVHYFEHIYLVLNKPSGYVSSNVDEGAFPSVMKLIKEPYNRYDLNICGRLDQDTEGLLLLTNDGDLLHKVISPKKEIYKKYYVKLKNKLKNYQVLEEGIEILDGMNHIYKTKNAKIKILDEYSCFIEICEGKFHQVKRMFEYINNEVLYLKRISIGNLLLNDKILIGEYISYQKEEIEKLLFD